jgi:multidrug efflux pump subunit AcrA (membrane-fusion protein)
MSAHTQTPVVENEPQTTPPPEERKHRAGQSIGAIALCLVLAVAAIFLGIKVRQQSNQLADVQAQLTLAKSDIASAQADADKAKSQSVDLQAQLDKAKGQMADLQTQRDQARTQRSDLQAQLDRAKAASAGLQAQRDQAKSRSDDLQARLSQAADESNGLRRELDQAKGQAADLQSRLDKAQGDNPRQEPGIGKARPSPVTTSFKKGFWSDEFTMHVNNPSPDPLMVTITITGSEKTRTAQTATIAGGATLDVGKLAAGDNVVITSNGYDPVNAVVR